MARHNESKLRHVIEALVSAFLLAFQYIPVLGPWMGFMILPLAVYVTGLLWAYPEYFGAQLNMLLLSERLMFGRIVAATGLVIFLGAFFQFLRRRSKIITGGLYSVVRHPQYFGIIVVTLGISIMSIQYAGTRPEVIFAWLIQVFGYVLLGSYEEWHLLRDREKEFSEYKQKASFMLPVPRLAKIPESLSTMMVVVVIAFLLTLL